MDMLNLDANLYSVDILKDLPAVENIPKWVPGLTDRLDLEHGRDVSAYLEKIGGDIDFCILDTAHFMPGEILNFICILPYLKVGATVVVHDQLHHFDIDAPFVKIIGSPWVISCRVLFDVVVADKLVPDLGDEQKIIAPNIASFTITEQTREHVDHILSALMLPWRIMPTPSALNDILNNLKINYPQHVIDYFSHIVEKQLRFHLDKFFSYDGFAKQYWVSLMQELKGISKEKQIVFYGAGSYCETIIHEWLPDDLYPKIIFDISPANTSINTVPLYNLKQLVNLADSISAIVITSNSHHKTIEKDLHKIKRLLHSKGKDTNLEIINPYVLQQRT